MNLITKQIHKNNELLRKECKRWALLAEANHRCMNHWFDECQKLKDDMLRYEQGYIKIEDHTAACGYKWIRSEYAVKCEVLEGANKELEKKLLDAKKFGYEQARQEFNLRVETEHKVVQARVIIQGLLDLYEHIIKDVTGPCDEHDRMLLQDAKDWVERNKKKE